MGLRLTARKARKEMKKREARGNTNDMKNERTHKRFQECPRYWKKEAEGLIAVLCLEGFF